LLYAGKHYAARAGNAGGFLSGVLRNETCGDQTFLSTSKRTSP